MSTKSKYTNIGTVSERYVIKDGEGNFTEVPKGTEGAERQLSLNLNPSFKILGKDGAEVKIGSIPLFKFDLNKALTNDKLSEKHKKFLSEKGANILYDVAIKAPKAQ